MAKYSIIDATSLVRVPLSPSFPSPCVPQLITLAHPTPQRHPSPLSGPHVGHPSLHCFGLEPLALRLPGVRFYSIIHPAILLSSIQLKEPFDLT